MGVDESCDGPRRFHGGGIGKSFVLVGSILPLLDSQLSEFGSDEAKVQGRTIQCPIRQDESSHRGVEEPSQGCRINRRQSLVEGFRQQEVTSKRERSHRGAGSRAEMWRISR